MVTVNEIRSSFLNYFVGKGHAKVDSSPLIPHNDPSLMFANSGMVQFKNYFIGVDTPEFKRATTAQKCVRAGGKHNDLENVGYTARHHTFFEMLGNFSFGDYFKEDAIFFAYDFLTRELGIDKNKLYFTVYHTDDEAYNLWKKQGVAESRIIRIPTSDNFWSMGDTGPCGPCSEIFYDHGESLSGGLPGQPDEGGLRYVEIWNLVFMQYEQKAGGDMINLPKPSIDTGMGLERFAAVMQGQHDNYNIDMFKNLISNIQDIAKVKTTEDNFPSFKVIADHLRSTAFLIGDGVMPSNEGRGYVLRRILRRAMRHVHHLHVKEPIIHKLLQSLINEMGNAYPELVRAQSFIYETIKLEETKFQETLDRGMKLLDQELGNLKSSSVLPGEVAFKLYDTFGFPLDLTIDILRKDNKSVDTEGFDREMQKQRENARKAWVGSGEQVTNEIWFDLKNKHGATEFLGYTLNSLDANVLEIVVNNEVKTQATKGEKFSFIANQTPFYAESGGQLGDTGFGKTKSGQIKIYDTKKTLDLHIHFAEVIEGTIETGNSITLAIDVDRRRKLRANHSASHLLHKVLRNILGTHITQKGSMVAEDRLRFDFSNNKPVSAEELVQIEQKVNELIYLNFPVQTKLMDVKQAVESGAMALFGEKYSEEVRVVTMGDENSNEKLSVELCGGTHVSATGDIGLFKITMETAIASGVRRIEAVTQAEAVKYVHEQEAILNEINGILKVGSKDFVNRINSIMANSKQLEKEIGALKRQALDLELTKFEQVGAIEFLAIKTSNIDFKDIKSWIDNVTNQKENRVLLMVIDNGDKATIVASCANPEKYKVDAVKIAEAVVKELGGSGCGGRPNFAQGGAPSVAKYDSSIRIAKEMLLVPIPS